MKSSVFKFLPVTIVLAYLSGCAGMNGGFGCHAKAGTGCTPVSQVNAEAQAGAFDYQTSGGRIELPTHQTLGYARSKNPLGRARGYRGTTPMPGEPVRFGERLQRIWIAPYQDLANNYHEPSYVYTVIEKPHWIGVPAKEIKTSKEG